MSLEIEGQEDLRGLAVRGRELMGVGQRLAWESAKVVG